MLAGKDKETNEFLVEQAEDENIVLHTEEKGSPFAEIKGKANKKDIYEAGVFVAKFSQDWKKNKKDVVMHYFKARDIYKQAGMPAGTFGVKKAKSVKIKSKDIQKFEQEIR